MWPETLFVAVGIIDKTLIKIPQFKRSELQTLGITAYCLGNLKKSVRLS
jgi:hypothetical protein